jgi:hypothetical protein
MKINKVHVNTNTELAGISPIVYHNTTVDKLVNIMEDNNIHLTNNLGTSSDRTNKSKKFKPYFLSMSRVKFGGYARQASPDWACCLVINGHKLAEKYSGESVDYWGREFRNGSSDDEAPLRYQENEDRIYSTEPTIKPLNKYITEVHINLCEYAVISIDKKRELTSKEFDKYYDFAKMYRKIGEYGTAYGIPIYFYKDYNAYMVQNKNKATKGFTSSRGYVDLINELFKKNCGDVLSEDADDLRSRLYYGSDRRDIQISIENNIHNSRSGSKAEKMIVDDFIANMRRHKLRDASTVLEFLKEKYESLKD